MGTNQESRLIAASCHFVVQLTLALVLLVLAGCSTAPIADMMDFFSPGRFPKDAKGVVGGVCIPQGGPAGGSIGPPPGLIGAPGPPAPPVGLMPPDAPPPPPVK
jgi:hypothetical protein